MTEQDMEGGPGFVHVRFGHRLLSCAMLQTLVATGLLRSAQGSCFGCHALPLATLAFAPLVSVSVS